jgi:methionyl-tRNA formyltransferase
MRIVFMGTPQFSVPPLLALAAAGHDIAGVVTRVDKPAGRGRVLASPPAKLAAREMGLAVFQPQRVREPGFIATLRELSPEAIVVPPTGRFCRRKS